MKEFVSKNVKVCKKEQKKLDNEIKQIFTSVHILCFYQTFLHIDIDIHNTLNMHTHFQVIASVFF